MFYRITISDDSRQDIAVLVNQASDTFKKAGKPKNCLINIESAFIHENSTNLEIFFVNIIAIIIDGMNIKNSADSIFNGDMRNVSKDFNELKNFLRKTFFPKMSIRNIKIFPMNQTSFRIEIIKIIIIKFNLQKQGKKKKKKKKMNI